MKDENGPQLKKVDNGPFTDTTATLNKLVSKSIMGCKGGGEES